MSWSASGYKRFALVLPLLAGASVAGAQAPERWPGEMPTPVSVTITDTTIDMPTAYPPGLVMFRVTNAGNQAHNFEIASEDFETQFARELAPGDTRELRVYLEPGRYTVYCPIEAHRHPLVSVDVRYAERIR